MEETTSFSAAFQILSNLQDANISSLTMNTTHKIPNLFYTMGHGIRVLIQVDTGLGCFQHEMLGGKNYTSDKEP